MEVLERIEALFNDYGYWVVFVGLLLEFIALPFPGETSMAYAGFLSYKGVLDIQWLIPLSFLGTTLGMTITYWIGRKVGLPFITKYGKWVFLSPQKLDKTKFWFEKYGYSLISLGYFIPGIRHFTGYFSGIIVVPFRKFAAYAYSGALIWTIVFLSIGKVFGPAWTKVFELAIKYLLLTSLAIVALLLGYILLRYRKGIYTFYLKRFKKPQPEPSKSRRN
ncbi:DedA family protein [Paenibacillus anaericanus]|uniref:DedA family protein n=1 Tax=Paenibacillus anaericanus TaxID=170367 RepID=UPI0027D900F2|nr:DedA family protein [Paenibacillus anaericanus]